MTLLDGQQEGHPASKKTEWWGAGAVICLGRGADWHMAQLMSLPPTVSCFSKIQIGFTFLVPAHLGSPGQWAVKRVLLLLYVKLTSMPAAAGAFYIITRMWANAQPDGRPAEHRWRPLFNAAKFGRRPLLDAVQ